MAKSYTVTADVFTVPYKNGDVILYAPLAGFAGVANADTIGLLAGLDELDTGTLNPQQKEILDFLDRKGILNGSKEYACGTTLPEKYTPTMVTLFPTNQCNLRCTYCYASAGDWKPMTMDWHTATSAVEIVIRNLKEKGARHFSMGFHGGGEPLYPWSFIKKIVEYAEDRCAREGLEPFIYAATNGLLSEIQLEWILKHFRNLNISFDGLPHVQDYHRPLPDGKGSFEFVDRTMRFLDAHNFTYGVRGTVSSYNIHLMNETIDFIGQNYKVKSVHLEPLFYCGRCKTSGTMAPEMQTFADHFMEAEPRCVPYDIQLTYSGCHLEFLRNTFCGVASDNFSVTPDGYVTTCFEVTDRSDEKSGVFFIGRIREDGTLEVDEKKRKFLHSLKVDNLEYCQDCFAKWHCGGECAAKLQHGEYTGERGHERCQLNRQLIRNRLIGLVEGTYQSPRIHASRVESVEKGKDDLKKKKIKKT